MMMEPGLEKGKVPGPDREVGIPFYRMCGYSILATQVIQYKRVSSEAWPLALEPCTRC